MIKYWTSLAAVAVTASLAPVRAAAPTEPVTILVEAESPAAGGATNRAPWAVRELEGASGGRVLWGPPAYGLPETDGLPVAVPVAGAYRVWVRYHKKTTAGAALYALFRDEEGEELAFQCLDWYPFVPAEKPYEKSGPRGRDRTGFVWESFDATFERPVMAALSFGSYVHGGSSPYHGGGTTERAVDCVLLTTDRALDPAAWSGERLTALGAATMTRAAVAPPPPPKGWIWSAGMPAHADFFAGVAEPDARFWAGLINCSSVFIDAARMVRMGFNRDHAHGVSPRHGIRSMAHVEHYLGGPELAKAHPAPEGRFVNAAGQAGNVFSFHFPPVQESSDQALEAAVRRYLEEDNGTVGWWRVSIEDGGFLDYSPYAQAAFREWLTNKHGTIDKLNKRWATKHASFDEIVPPPAFTNGPSAWLEFRAFSGSSYAAAVARQLPIIRRLDPKKRPCLGATSSLDFFSPYFSAFRPIDLEEFIHVALAGEELFSWDTYCADDQLGAETDFVRSLSEGRGLMIQEWSNHVTDPRIAARSYWTYVTKGIRGIHLFMFQEGVNHASYPKWSLLSHDRSPKAKLAAYSDAAQEVHRLEPLLARARFTHAVKPVALYWSRMDLSLEKPHESLYGAALDSPFHLYRTLRSLGYPVRWITPRQIEAGELASVAALVMAGCEYVPQAAAARIEAWVKDGGVVIADGFPGAFDEYGRPQATLTPVFGVRTKTVKAKGKASEIALQESTQGYGEVTDAAVVRREYFEKIEEVAQQPGATHPVAVALGDFMVSGISLDPVECFAGTVIGMSHSGNPGFILNEYGKGQALYSDMLLGTIYESAGTRFEWDTTHAGLGYGRILDTFLKHAGAKPAARIDGLAARVAAKVRVESPLVNADGNVVIGLTSLNDDAIGPFDLTVELPEGAEKFQTVLATKGGSRAIEPVKWQVNGSVLTVRVPRFDTHAAIVAARDAGPLVSLELKDVRRGEAGLAEIATGQTVAIEAVVHNPSPRKLGAGEVTLTLPAGWLQSALSARVGPIKPGGEARCTFRVRAPEFARAKRIEPLVAKYAGGQTKSTPCTEMVWWGIKEAGDTP